MDLFAYLSQERDERAATAPGRLNLSARIHAAIKNAIKNAKKSREIIADDMSELLGLEITIDKLYNWTAESHPHRMPGEYYAAFCIRVAEAAEKTAKGVSGIDNKARLQKQAA